MLGVVRGGLRIAVDETILERAVDEDRELAGRRGDRTGFAHPVGQAEIESAEHGLGAATAHGRDAQGARGAVGGGRRLGAEEAAAGGFVVGRQGQPGGEVLLGGPAAHVGANLGLVELGGRQGGARAASLWTWASIAASHAANWR
jgi:hypothetical protein